EPGVAQAAQHPVGVEDRLLNPLRREQAARALEEALALEVEAPGGGLMHAGGAARVQIEELLHELALEDREVLGVAVRKVRVVVYAPVRGDRRVALVDDARQVAELRVHADGVERRAHLAQHLEARRRLQGRRRPAERAVDAPGREASALRVEGHEVERGAGARAVREKTAEDLVAAPARPEIAGGSRPADR